MRRSLLLSVLIVLASAADAQACSCVQPEEVLSRADGVFVGKVVERRGSQRLVYTFAVERVVRGELPERLELQSTPHSASCGIDLEVGRRIGVMLGQGDRHVGICNVIDPDELEGREPPPPRPERLIEDLLSVCRVAGRAMFLTMRAFGAA